MTNVQVRLPNKIVEEIDRLSKTLKSSRSEVIRKAVRSGISHMKMENALKDYVGNKVTLCKAASMSNVSVREFAEFATKKGIPFMRYSEKEAEEDLARLRKSHEGTD